MARSKAVHRFVGPLWSNPDEWRDEFPGHVFLARAVDTLGRARFGPAWEGVEWAGAPRTFPDPTSRYSATGAIVLDAASRLARIRPDMWADRHPALDQALQSLRASSGAQRAQRASDIACWFFTADMWRAAQPRHWDDEETSELDQTGDPAAQWTSVIKELVHQFQRGTLTCFRHPEHGGEFKEVLPHEWLNHSWMSRFDTCTMRDSPRDEWDEPEADYLYVCRAGLESLLAQQPHLASLFTDIHYLPPFLKFLVQAAVELDLREDEPDRLKPEIEEALEALGKKTGIWLEHDSHYGGHKNLKEVMATILRQPGADRGPTGLRVK
jgi:hypothetical protein